MNHRARKSARTERGFTLVELMVSLVAGLLVTIAVVGLARSATTTFYEQARLSTVEGTVRSASERLRQDLSRVSFMSTGNITLALNSNPSVPVGHKISHVPGATTGSRYSATNDLQGIRIFVAGSKPGAQGANNLSSVNGLDPDAIEITGNLTTDDSYRGKYQAPNQILLSALDDAAVGRLLGNGPPARSIRNAFTPGAPVGAVPPFVVRVTDPRGCHHFAILSNVTASATTAIITLAPALIGTPVLQPTQDQSTCGATDQEEVTISPIATARWYIGPTATVLQGDPGVEDVTNKFDLYREIRDATGAPIPSPGGPQVVAEYAIDLKFGISVDDHGTGVVPPANHKIFDMDTDSALIDQWTQKASGTAAGQPAPHRVRSVRFRLATRTAIPDREEPLTIYPSKPYISRYCVGTPCKRFSRVRTIMSEVALINQAGMSY
jgi:type II secretory pathway pseudopilin PulG